MIDVHWEIDGRRVSPSQVGNALEQSIYKQLAESLKKELSSVRCPEHGQRPTVVFKGKRGKELSFEIKGCCEQLIDKATAAVK